MANVAKLKASDGWQQFLTIRKDGTVKKTLANLELIFNCHDAWRGLLVKDSFAERVLAVRSEDDRSPPGIDTGIWTDVATTRARVWLSEHYGVEFDAGAIDSVVDSIADRQKRHPVREYLKSLTWDGHQRLPNMLTTYFGTTDNDYHASIATMWMISGVARVFEPGCQADYMLVLIGSQGTRKSSALRVLAKSWAADSMIMIGTPDSMHGLQGVWIYEIAELAAIKAARDIERVKLFVTSRVDHFRKPYGRRYQEFPRQCIFAGTTNDETPLSDAENRRFWTVDCGRIDLESLKRDVDQLWAEALVRYEMKEPWHPNTKEVVEICKTEQAIHTRVDPWLPIVERWLARSATHFEFAPGSWEHFNNGVSTTEALQGAIGMSRERIDHYASSRMGRVLKDCGFKTRRTGENRTRRYFKDSVPEVDDAPIDYSQEQLFP